MHSRSRLVRVGIAELLAVWLLVAPAAAQSRDVSASKIQIDNFGQINNTYYRGAQPQGRDYTDLASLGVKTLINLTSDDADANEQAMAERAGMKYMQIPMTTHTPPSAEQLTQFLALVNDPANQPVYVHCVGGRHRTGVMTAAYRMTQDGWTSEQAFAEMKKYKFGADFLHPEFKAFVYDYRAPALAAPVAVAATKVGG
jgi:protein tyrosine/serine phosphatase